MVGYGDVTQELPAEFSHLPRAISIAIRHDPADARVYYRGALELVAHHDPAVDYRLGLVQKRTARRLRQAGHRFFVIPPDSEVADERFVARLYPKFPHKRAATCAGLGWVGKSGLLVHRRFGPRLSWATVLTDAALPAGAPIVASRCGSCDACVRACPVGAIRGAPWRRGSDLEDLLDVEACRRQVVANHGLSGRYICGVCAVACPIGSPDAASVPATAQISEV